MRQIFKAIGWIALAGFTFAGVAHAQMGGGMGGGARGGGGHGGGHHRGGGQRGQGAPGGQPQGQPGPILPPAAIPLAMRLTGAVVVNGTSQTLSHAPLVANKPDYSAVFVSRGGSVTLDTMQIESHGVASLLSDTRTSGLNSALLVNSGSSATVTGGNIATTGPGGNGAYADGRGTRLVVDGAVITTEATGAYGLEISDAATLDAKEATVTTASDHAPALAGENGGAMTLTGGHYTTGGPDSPAIAVSNDLNGTGITAAAAKSDGLAVAGAHMVTLSDSHLNGDRYALRLTGDTPVAAPPLMPAKPGAGVIPAEAMLAQPVSDGATVTIDGGELDGRSALFYVSNSRAHITLSNVGLKSGSGVLVKAAAGQQGELGRNGGIAIIDARNQILTGDMATDVISRIRLNLGGNSHFTGLATHQVDVALDATSTWVLTGDCGVGLLSIDGVTSPNQISQIDSQGHTLSYDDTRNAWLGGKTYALKGGGTLKPGL